MAAMSVSGRLLLILPILACACLGDSSDLAKELGAVLQVRTLNNAQVQYYSQSGKYASKLAELGPAGADLIPAELASGTKGGYRFTLAGGGEKYTIHADPVENPKERRFFFSDESAVIRQSRGAPATARSSEVA